VHTQVEAVARRISATLAAERREREADRQLTHSREAAVARAMAAELRAAEETIEGLVEGSARNGRAFAENRQALIARLQRVGACAPETYLTHARSQYTTH
jgi:hypothetical protein